MLGALEVRAINRLANAHRPAWKPLHTAIMDCLLAHRNRLTSLCWPERSLLATHCAVSERTVDRAISQLTEWGALEKQQPRNLSQQFRATQYVFLFKIPEQPSDKPCDKSQPPCAKNAPSRSPNSPITVRQNRGANKEEEKDLKGKILRGRIPRNLSVRNSQLLNNAKEECPMDEADITPDEFPAIEYAKRLLEEVGCSKAPSNARAVADAITCEHERGLSKAAAYDLVLDGTRRAQREGVAITTFFFNDGRYRENQNRRSYERGDDSKAQQRSQRGQKAIVDAARDHARQRTGGVPAEREGGSGTGTDG